ncbi:hypothetical protein PtB15_5B632 [Puccinia triticina]|nr:hypothetical protein PtB15_5B632 [Puccinia triticina]
MEEESFLDPNLLTQQTLPQTSRTSSQPGTNTHGRAKSQGRGRGQRSTGPIRSLATKSVDPENNTYATTTAAGVTRKKLLWTGPMELMMLDLYVEEVHKGKRSDSGFQSTSHWHFWNQSRIFSSIGLLVDRSSRRLDLAHLSKAQGPY